MVSPSLHAVEARSRKRQGDAAAVLRPRRPCPAEHSTAQHEPSIDPPGLGLGLGLGQADQEVLPVRQ